ncbi:MAG: hypothetical protein UX99_C0021G0004 [Candidatus Amesbacteria bacterium GW2011_GWB1_47_26]|uniref:EfeO-type cupredoxin-like domain-containing protein n=1 Tax=Candidatus Amesbacteria bacterium GW2011_GWC2_45_19 TaxID=1618366 RepID=A0A0G1M243_9BACT|nr:MAG: hypothetical protein UX05_C0015G0005 [Candidatus Amesbacteria bacterium GW2011_GWC2_45_19]KKU38200.1 MAG: hypothetical protein UX52_C0009G0007 [Candidatus Amesbacteria bacterium GW2011_GWA1_46_35]KKU68174.1 MAG: hypothetical protein UX93_C0010G0029 [Microgenomates group bacterium GW2011_GWC1_47_20]KKU74216.1 MAG: hypothetical protein UX99_C0021G0004 [Candidatus Amesbacteria bacterium GW2011_GWB1_47_26]KKU79837.1 MAG: hypothetical protein UY06_C0012G0008 [Candidatus Amesbacteria bacteriu
MRAVFLSVLVIVALLAAGYYLFQRPKMITKNPEEVLNKVEAMDVQAKDGKFTPDSFKVELFDTMKLNISAVDRDYVFKVRDYPRMDVSIPAGKTVVAPIVYLGVGDYVFDCGEDCTGTITVVQEKDTEGEEPN